MVTLNAMRPIVRSVHTPIGRSVHKLAPYCGDSDDITNGDKGQHSNITSEDAIHMLDAMGYDTGMDLSRLLPIARELTAIVGHAVPGQVAKSGRITDLHPAPPSVAELKMEFS